MREKVEPLKYHADMGPQRAKIGLRIDLLRLETNGAGLNRFEPVDAAEHRAFAGTAGTDDNDFFAFQQLQIEVFQDFHRTEGFVNVFHLDDAAHCRAILLSSLSAITMNTEFMIR